MPKDFWYIAPKEGQKYAMIGSSNWSDTASKVEFDELGFISEDDFYHVYAYATKFKGIASFGDKSWEFKPQLVKFRVARKDHEKEDKEKKKVVVTQSRLEKWICSLFGRLEEGKIYSGFINLQDDEFCLTLATGIDHNTGNQIPEEVLRQMEKMQAYVVEVTEPKHVLAEDIEIPKGKKGGFGYGGSKGQTELEKLNDRVAFICQQLGFISPELKISNLAEIHEAMQTFDGYKANIEAVFGYCTNLMM
jgi:hypothetical protein